LAGDASGETDHSAAPCATLAEIEPILRECAVRPASPDLPFQSVNHAFWWRRAIIVWLVMIVTALGTGYLVHGGLFAIILLAIPVTLVLFLNWRHHQYAIEDSQLYVRSGWWRRKLTILLLRKVQSLDVSQSPLDHPLDLATLTIGIAGGSTVAPLRISDIPLKTAVDLRARLFAVRNHP
jgi:putative membrane protein